MASKAYWTPLSRHEYEEGRERRLQPDNIEDGQVVNSPRIGHPEDRLGCYAVEFLVEISFVVPNDDVYEVGLYLLDADGHRVSKKQAQLTGDGIIRNPLNSAIEGYFLDANEKLGLGPLAVNETLSLVS